MDLKKLLLVLVFAAAVALMVARPGQSLPALPAQGPTPVPNPELEKPALEAALRAATQSEQKAMVPAMLLYQPTVDQVELSADGKTALVWMGLIDPQTQQVVATEPGLAIGSRETLNAPWQIKLPTAADFLQNVLSLPDSLLSPQEKNLFETTSQPDAALDQVLTGYLLPWEGGRRVWLTGSVAHFTTYNSCNWVTVNGVSHSTCRYAFDFADGTNFRILASRGGTVVGSRWTCINNDHYCLNYIALEDTSTTPTTTAIYLHLAYDSIPPALRVNGTYVNQGDFVALVDNTGLSTGSHLHFMVVGNRWWGTTYGGFWWGDSVDITFEEVSINGGRPRLCSEAYYTPLYGNQCVPKNEAIGEYYDNWFISENWGGAAPPTAKMSDPAAYSAVQTPAVTVSGSATAKKGLSFTRVAANYNNSWVEIGPKITTNPFTASIDLCAAGVPNGAVTLGLFAYDLDGNRSAVVQDPRPVSFQALCTPPPPQCAPTANQVSIYSQPDYQGACQVLNVGKYDAAQFAPVGNNQVASVQVGANVMAVLYDGNYEAGLLKDRSEAFLASDPGLADNRIGIRTSSVEVKAKVKPSAPLLRAVYNVLDSQGKPVPLTVHDPVTLVWKGADSGFPPDEGGTEYRAELTLPDGTKRASGWQTANSWGVGSLAAGSYTWTVTARNPLGETQSAAGSFTIASSSALPGSPVAFPYSEGFESGSTGWLMSGLWRRAASPDLSHNSPWAVGFTSGTNYADAQTAGGALTSPPISIPAGGAVLRFRTYSLTEDNGPYWDQRRVQISANGGPFQDILQLWDEPVGEWQSSPTISLAAYAGKTIRVRFAFHTIDAYNNAFAGWWVDSVAVTANEPSPTCAEAAPNDSAATATHLAVQQTVTGFICPAGDVDFYKFGATAGATVSADIAARSEGSDLDSYLILLDGDGKSILVENDDVKYGTLQDPHISYTFQRSGTYFLKLKAYNHPGVGGVENPYRLSLRDLGGTLPALPVISPLSSWVNGGTVNFEVSSAGLTSVTKVDFYWHSPNWRAAAWELLGSDASGGDGWSASLNPSGRIIEGSALMARAYDGADQVATALIWNLRLDSVAPVATLKPLPATNQSTAVALSWTVSEAASGIHHYVIQVQDGSGTWVDMVNPLPGTSAQAFFQGVPGHTYSFRMWAIDRAGNQQAAPSNVVTTTLAQSCVPDANDAAGAGDNTKDQAVPLAFKQSQQHNFCRVGQVGQQPQAAYGDEDWYRISAKAGDRLKISATSVSGGAAASLALLDASGNQVLAQNEAFALGQPAAIFYTFPATGDYLVRVRPLDPGLWGSDARYTILFSSPEGTMYFPIINH